MSIRRTLVSLAALVLLSAGCSGAGSPTSSSVADSTVASTTTTTAATTTTTTATTTPPTTASSTTSTNPPTTTSEQASVQVGTGAHRLVAANFAPLDGKRVGLIAHQSSVVGDSHIADLLNEAPNVELVATFGPEHGLRGTADAGEFVPSEIDPETGLPVFSLYGPTRQPTTEMLEGIDVLVYDLQDVGTRYYTYISTMGLAMQAAAANNIEFVVLERPNPLGGLVGGGVLEADRTSFVGQYPIPDIYGLTSMELAAVIIAEELLPGLEDLNFSGVPTINWTKSMRWEDTGLEWIPPSPAITSPDTALLYPATIYFEATSLSYGRGTEMPFEVLGAPWLNAEALQAELASRDLPGVEFDATSITPEMLATITVVPAYLGETIPAVQLEVTDPQAIRPAELGLHLLDAVFAQARAAGVDPLSRPEWLDQLSGSTLLRRGIAGGEFSVDEILAQQDADRDTLFDQLESYPR